MDVGCGSGLSSLAAVLLGARVFSFDYDPLSVECARELKRRYFPDSDLWAIESGSALDKEFLRAVAERYGGGFDIVYSWGVLHHTGAMREAMENVGALVRSADDRGGRGKLFISIYNDQGRRSKLWRRVKKTYCSSPKIIKRTLVFACLAYFWARPTITDLARLKPFESWRNYKNNRGMSAYYDVVDIVGGYPFEVAKPEEIFYFYRDRGFVLRELFTCGGGLGCNQFVFEKGGAPL